MVRRAFVTSLIVTIAALFTDGLILGGGRVPGAVMFVLCFLPITVYIVAKRLMAAERRNRETIRTMYAGLLRIISK